MYLVTTSVQLRGSHVSSKQFNIGIVQMIHTVALQDILIQIRGSFSPKFEKKIKKPYKKASEG